MKDFIKKYYKSLLLVLGYTVVAEVVYIILFESLWHKWYLDLIIAFAILVLAGVIGFFYIKDVMKNEPKEEKMEALDEDIKKEQEEKAQEEAETKNEDEFSGSVEDGADLSEIVDVEDTKEE